MHSVRSVMEFYFNKFSFVKKTSLKLEKICNQNTTDDQKQH